MAADNTDGQCKGSEYTAQCFQKIAVRQLGNMAAIGMRHEITMSEMQHNEAAQAMGHCKLIVGLLSGPAAQVGEGGRKKFQNTPNTGF